MRSKWKKMIGIIALFYYLIATIVYFISGGFLITKSTKSKITFSKKLNKEFVYAKKNRIYKGVYAGINTFQNQDYHVLQFSDILLGENRFVNVYISELADTMPAVIETTSKLSGKASYLVLNPYGYYGGNNIVYDLLFEKDTLVQPVDLVNTLNTLEDFKDKIEFSTISTPLFACALTVMDEDIKLDYVYWTANNDSSYTTNKNQKRLYAWEKKGKCKIDQKERKTSNTSSSVVFAAAADIITSPIQLIIGLVFIIMVLFAGGPVK